MFTGIGPSFSAQETLRGPAAPRTLLATGLQATVVKSLWTSLSIELLFLSSLLPLLLVSLDLGQ